MEVAFDLRVLGEVHTPCGVAVGQFARDEQYSIS